MRSSLLTVLIALTCWAGAHALDRRALDTRASWPVGESQAWLPPIQAAPILAMGQRQLWADVLWARMLVYYGSNLRDTEVYQYRYLTRYIDTIMALDPQYERVYEWAAYAVLYQGTVPTQEEYRLSAVYLERAMAKFPHRYEYAWLAGLRYYFDIKSDDPDEQARLREHGADLIEQAMHKPDAPGNLATLAYGLRSKLGQRERALNDLREVILTTDDPKAQADLIRRYRQLAGQEFPEEMTRAKEAFEARWSAEMSFAPPDLYVILGPRPAPAIDLEHALAPAARFDVSPPEGAGDVPDPDPDSDTDTGAAPAPAPASAADPGQ
ncbi:hypothetical protein [Haliangium sp.]|uniref:hypothetical protein n=1 Tax=Haliangium sp. TaxID=2663208 RepID=UPI003D0C109B